MRGVVGPGWLMCVLLMTGCRCSGPVTKVMPAELTATPMRLVVGPVYVGQEAHGTVEVANLGAAPTDVDVAIDSPFSTSVERLQLVRGESADVVVTFAPVVAGQVSTRLTVGTLDVEVIGEALEIPMCTPSSVCADARFDSAAEQCLESTKEDGARCETSCVLGGCAGGTCLGQLKGCDDNDACTIDACSEVEGCSHSPRTCPAAAAPCQAARCDPVTGCGVEPVPDGTLCGPDDCTAVDVDVCIIGQCVRRTRNATGRCANRWVSMNIPVRTGSAMAYDAVRQRLVLFGGNSGTDLRFDTWEWNGSAWEERIPANAPSARQGHAMTWDPVRRRVVLFGGTSWLPATTPLADLWEWDGITWVQRPSSTAPPARTAFGMAYDVARQRLVVFGGMGTAGRLSDTWEWDGTNWTELTPSSAPSARSNLSMGYDGVRQRVLLFGGSGEGEPSLGDTWEWNGTSWLEKRPALSPPPNSSRRIAWDGRRERLVLFGGGTWEWDGATWSAAATATSPSERVGYAMGWDGARERVVVFGGFVPGGPLSDTWVWDGTTWTIAASVTLPPRRNEVAMAYDAARQRLVLFGGPDSSETWAWNTDWQQLAPLLSPSARSRHALAYDSARQRVVLLGGRDDWVGDLADTWEWDGVSWLERTPQSSLSPRTSDHAMAFDEARQRVVLFDWEGTTWEWDGTTWTRPSLSSSPSPRSGHAMAYDPVRRRVLLFGGTGSATSSGTWEWDGVTWVHRITASAPSNRYDHAMAWDTARQRLVLFGGYRLGGSGPPRLQDTWEWDGANWTERMPVTSPPRSSGHSMAFHEARNRIVVVAGADTWVFIP